MSTGNMIFLGLLLGWYKNIWAFLNPIAQVLRPISPMAWLPFIVLFFGIGEMPALVIIFIAAFFPVLLATVAAVSNIEPVYLKVAQNFGIRQPAQQMHPDAEMLLLLPGAGIRGHVDRHLESEGGTHDADRETKVAGGAHGDLVLAKKGPRLVAVQQRVVVIEGQQATGQGQVFGGDLGRGKAGHGMDVGLRSNVKA